MMSDKQTEAKMCIRDRFQNNAAILLINKLFHDYFHIHGLKHFG